MRLHISYTKPFYGVYVTVHVNVQATLGAVAKWAERQFQTWRTGDQISACQLLAHSRFRGSEVMWILITSLRFSQPSL